MGSHRGSFVSSVALAALAALAALTTVGCAGSTQATQAVRASRPAAAPPAARVYTHDELRVQLANARQVRLAQLRAYVAAGDFAAPGVLVDAAGRLSAVAAIMDASGEGDLIRYVAAHSNDFYLAEAKDGPLLDWLLGSGLTAEDVALLQMPYARGASPAELRAHFERIEERLRAGSDASLDVAADRLVARRAELARRKG